MHAIVVTPEGTWERADLDFAGCQAAVGGYVELLRLSPGVWAFVNENGIAEGLPYNRLATLLCRRLGTILAIDDYIKGTMVLLGPTGNRGLTDAAVIHLQGLLSDLKRDIDAERTVASLGATVGSPPASPPAYFPDRRPDDAIRLTEAFVRVLLPTTGRGRRGGQHNGLFGRVYWSGIVRTVDEAAQGDGKDFIVWVNGEVFDWRKATRGVLRRICYALGVATSEQSLPKDFN